MKPFNLEQALAGEPVKLRDGNKAYVKYVMPEEYKGDYPLRGIFIDIHSSVHITEVMWTMDSFISANPKYDIVGMWEAPRPKVTLTLPCPLKEPQEGMWNIMSGTVQKSTYTKIKHSEWYEINKRYLNAGFFFATQEDAQEWLDAIKGARR